MDTILNYKEPDLDFGIDEGINDPGIFKAVVLAGGPGSGKSFVAQKLGLKTLGLVVVNSDLFFVQMMKRKGLSLKMPASETEDREVARLAAKASTDRRLKNLVEARMGVLIDSTSGDQKKTEKIIKMLKKAGYDVKVIFIQTSLDTALRRNKERSRSIPETVVEFSWKGAQKVKPILKRLVGTKDYHEVENNFDGKVDTSMAGKLTVWSKVYNSHALEWIESIKRGYSSIRAKDELKEDINNIKEAKIKGLEKKAKESKYSYSVLKKVYDRGMGAYKTNPGSVRPNVSSPQQWAFARVNSFIKGGHDEDDDLKESLIKFKEYV